MGRAVEQMTYGPVIAKTEVPSNVKQRADQPVDVESLGPVRYVTQVSHHRPQGTHIVKILLICGIAVVIEVYM